MQPFCQSAGHFYEKREGPGSGSVLVTNGSGRPKHTDPTDTGTDPEHWLPINTTTSNTRRLIVRKSAEIQDHKYNANFILASADQE